MAINKISEFAKDGERSITGLTISDGFPQSQKPARQWFNYLFNTVTKSINELVDAVNELQDTNYKIKAINSNYSIIAADCNSKTIIRSETSQAITVTIPVINVPIGSSVNLRRTSGELSIVGAQSVSILPTDSLVLRRDGSTATLVYVGNNVWDLYSELGE